VYLYVVLFPVNSNCIFNGNANHGTKLICSKWRFVLSC